MATVLITGGTGMIGKALSALLLRSGHSVIVLTRAQPLPPSTGNLSYASWDVHKQEIDMGAVQRADYIMHLAGAGVAEKRWTSKRMAEIKSSRTESSALLVKALSKPNKVKAVISTSAIGWYGPDPQVPNPEPFTEARPVNDDFLGETCKLWEQSIQPVSALVPRLVILRLGVVLSPTGGALKEFIKPLRLGIAGILGNGRQVISWIHIDDVCRIYLAAMEDEQINGVYNAVAPKPVNNKTLTMMLAKKIRGKFYIPVYVPSFFLKLALGKLSVEVLKSATVSGAKIRLAGFNFVYPTIEAAINAEKF